MRSAARRITPLSAILALALIVGCGGGSGSGSGTAASGAASAATTLRVAYVPATTVLPLHVAERQGFFRANKLDVKLIEAANISEVPVALGRQFDLSLGTATDLIRAGGAGIDVLQVAGNTVSTKKNPFVRVVVRRGSGIRKVTDLEGKRVGTPTLTGVIHVGLLYWAKKEGADPSKIMGVEAPSPALPDQLKAGRVDAVEALEPFATQLTKAGNPSIGDPFSHIKDPLATNFWIARGAWARAHKGVVSRYVKAMERARAFIAKNPQKGRRILQGYTKLPPKVASKVPLPTWDFKIRTRDLVTWEQVLKDLGQLKRDVDPNKLVLSAGG
jgi:NitT/TauT family transport system substrate-binding protein